MDATEPAERPVEAKSATKTPKAPDERFMEDRAKLLAHIASSMILSATAKSELSRTETGRTARHLADYSDLDEEEMANIAGPALIVPTLHEVPDVEVARILQEVAAAAQTGLDETLSGLKEGVLQARAAQQEDLRKLREFAGRFESVEWPHDSRAIVIHGKRSEYVFAHPLARPEVTCPARHGHYRPCLSVDEIARDEAGSRKIVGVPQFKDPRFRTSAFLMANLANDDDIRDPRVVRSLMAAGACIRCIEEGKVSPMEAIQRLAAIVATPDRERYYRDLGIQEEVGERRDSREDLEAIVLRRVSEGLRAAATRHVDAGRRRRGDYSVYE